MPLEDDLRRTLRRIDPPPGFDTRVLARVRARDAARSLGANAVRTGTHRRRRTLTAVLALAASATLAIGGAWLSARREAARGEAARAQVIEALRITSETLSHVHAHVVGQAARDKEPAPAGKDRS